ncbi:eCIS core domain-containing protein [Billgrantia montanilacus]|uniref:DUF4157 domain-containing protein n=1 Tax=Billgrantia montanilacus TaxID=2282305 RepID=A0A368TWV1_9GAMM|nr:DUF4157 domain-containing protein [Halomonas montanilacus]RCV89158.1 DUF4157 domain-containing protein [Halomonas montanilacus]
MTAAAKTSTTPASVEVTRLPTQLTDTPGPAAWIQRVCACGAAAGISGECPDCAAAKRLGLQAKLGINPPDDRWEREADRIADKVVSEHSRAPEQPLSVTPLVQRQVDEEEEEDREEIQTKPSTSRGISRKVAAASKAAAALNSGGRPLSSAERTYFEPRFGRDFSAVRLHDDSRSGSAARAIGARAYTLGSNIAFAPGEYAPHTPSGRRLIAHELTHTLQQEPAAASLQRAESGGTFRGFFRNIALFFGAKVSDSEMETYLNQIEELGGPALDYVSDNKALSVANRIEAGNGLFGHTDTVDLRKILILDMQDGVTFGDEEVAILYLMTSLDALQIMQLFEGPNALDANTLRSDIDGDNRQRLDSLLNALGISAQGLEAQENYEACQPVERNAIAEAMRLSRADIAKAIELLESDGVSEAVRNSFYLAFRVEDPSTEQINTMIARLKAVREGVGRVHYICDHGEEMSSSCNNGAGGHASLGPTGNGVSICFMSSSGENAANLAEETNDAAKSNLITHEAAHFYLRVDDNGYFGDQCDETEYARSCLNGTRENCGTSGRPADERFNNADSYSCFVFYLARLTTQDPEEESANDPLTERAEAFRGANLDIQIDYPESILDVALFNEVYIDEPERTEHFVVTGAPAASGFSYHWAIDVGGESLPLAADEIRGMTVKPIAYVPEETKERLRNLHDAGETEAEVVLNTTLYRDAPESSSVERRLRVRLVPGEANLGIF